MRHFKIDLIVFNFFFLGIVAPFRFFHHPIHHHVHDDDDDFFLLLLLLSLSS